MTITPLELPDVLLLEQTLHSDERGWFVELWHSQRAAQPGIPSTFMQDNAVYSRRAVLRGLHFQQPYPQGKLVTALHGEIFDVAVDVRAESATFGRWTASALKAGRALYIPPGFAHGYQVLSEEALVIYKCTEHYHPQSEHILAWNDPELAIPWPIQEPRLSEKDRRGKRLAEFRS